MHLLMLCGFTSDTAHLCSSFIIVEGFTWHTHLVHPKKILPKKFLNLPKKFFTLVWKNRSRRPFRKRNFHPKNYFSLRKKIIFQTKKVFKPAWKNRFLTRKKNFLYLPEKKIKGKTSHNYQKIQFSKQKVSYTCLKTNFFYLFCF